MAEDRAGQADTAEGLLGIGQKVGNYRVTRLLGSGGMGAVYEAVHVYIERQAAVKVLHPDLSRNPRFAHRFLNEARAVNLIKHPGLVEIFEFGLLDNGTAYIIMEFLAGETLGHHIKGGPEQVGGEALFISRQIAQAMAAAHHKGIIHRDLKPDNVMLVPDPERPGRRRIKVLDFGIAKVTSNTDVEMQTQTGTTVGTPAYMSPEQCTAAGMLDGKSDVYSLGIILYEMLAGCLPFKAQHSFDFMASHVRQEPHPLREIIPSVPEPVAVLVHQMLAKDPAARPSMEEVVVRLDQMRQVAPDLWSSAGRIDPYNAENSNSIALAATMAGDTPAVSPRPVAARRRWPAVLAGGLLALGVVAYVATHRARPVTQAATPVLQDHPAQKVKWTLHSRPDGAQVVRADGAVLGVTPVQIEVPAGPGQTQVTLRHADYQDKHLDLSNDHDSGWDLELAPVAVVATPAPPAPVAPVGGKSAATSKPHKARPRPGGEHTDSGDVKLLMD